MDDGAVKNFLLVWNEHEDNIFCSKIKQKNSKVYRGALGKGNASFHDMLVWFLCDGAAFIEVSKIRKREHLHLCFENTNNRFWYLKA